MKHFFIPIILFICFYFGITLSMVGQVNSVGKLETAFLFHFGENIEWPEQDDFKVYQIYYLGNNKEVISGLQTLSKHKKIKNKPIIATYGNNISRIPPCHILFIDPSFNDQLKGLFSDYENLSTLIVTQDYEDESLVMINFVSKGTDKLQIRINNENLSKKNLTAHSDLMIYGGSEIDRAKIYQQWKKSLNVALDSLENERNKVKAFEEEVQELKDEIKLTQETLSRKQKEVEKNNQLIEGLQKKISTQESRLAVIRQELEEMQNSLRKKQELIALEEEKIQNLEKDIDQKYIDIQKNDEILKDQLATIKEQQGKINQSNQKVKEQDLTIAKQRMVVFISISAVLIITLLIFLVLRASKMKELALSKLKLKNAEILEQRAQLQSQAEELTATNEQINIQKSEIENTLKELQETQSQLVLAEKMAMLGQTAAGIAHEINTPLGAINSSAENIISYYNEYAKTFLRMLDTVDRNLLPLYFQMIMANDRDKDEMSTREMRQLRREVTKKLELQGEPNAHELAELVVDLGIQDSIDRFRPLLESPDNKFIFKSANNAKQLLLSSKNIIAAVQRASKIIVTLKTYARKDQVDYKERVNLKENILTVLIIYHNQLKNFVVKKSLPNLSKPLFAYADELGQIWTNLIHNAMHAMGTSGTLEITYEEKDDKVVVCIKDNGTGIPEDIQNRIFEPLFTTKKKEEGTGLGLDIVKKIVEKHDGKIYFTSEIGVGTSFFVELPLNVELALL